MYISVMPGFHYICFCQVSPSQMAPAFRKVYDQMPEPRWVVSITYYYILLLKI